VTRTKVAAYAVALLAAFALGHFLLGLPIQVSDSFGNLQQLSASWRELIETQFTRRAFLRPFLWAELKLVYELADGNYTPWFRWTHAAQVGILAVLFVALVRPRSWRDVACVPLGLAVLFGMHTFTGTVQEAFPVNTFQTLLILSFAAALVAFARYHWINDVVAAILFVVAALTVETGLLVWVILIGAALVGARGVSRPGLAVLTVLLGGYFYARFAVLQVGSPDLLERSSGFGFSVLDPPQLVERFGANPLPFYVYNVVSSLLSVLFSEPAAGVFRTTQAAIGGHLPAPLVVNLVASVGVLALLIWFVRVRHVDWRARRFEHGDRLVLLFGMVLVANAVISYPYTKETNMAPAGAFLALAAYASARHLLATVPAHIPRAAAVALVAATVAVSSGWSLRTLRMFTVLRHAAVVERLDWAYIESDIADGRVHPSGEAGRALLEQLKHDALIARPAPPPLTLPFLTLYGE
jgi:hypothetical protein